MDWDYAFITAIPMVLIILFVAGIGLGIYWLSKDEA